MDKHLFQHYCMDSKGCMDCGWRSDLHINPKTLSEEDKRKLILRLYTDIGKHLREVHMSRPEAHDAQIPERKGYRITSNALRCMDCNALQDDIKSLQEHIKLCPKSSKPAVFVCYCRAEFADRKSFDQHINMMQCKELLLRKFQGLPFVPGFPPNMRPPTVAPPKPPQSRSPVSKVRKYQSVKAPYDRRVIANSRWGISTFPVISRTVSISLALSPRAGRGNLDC